MTRAIFKPTTKLSLQATVQKIDVQVVYEKQQDVNRKAFVMLDGPPYANGHIHMGHVLNKIQKDITNQLAYMHGLNYVYVKGSDCHGLPIEKTVEKELGAKYKAMSAIEIRRHCREFANKWIEVQNKEFDALGVFSAKKHFKTMDCALDIVRKFHGFVKQGFVYKGVKPIMWSIAEKTSMATAEIEYKQHQSIAIDVGFEVVRSDFLPIGVYCVIWTTTAWTIPANRAIAYGKKISYVLIESDKGRFVVAESLVERFVERAQLIEWKIVQTFTGDKLQGTICAHPLREYGYGFDVPLLEADHVTESDGTGLVHTAPAHGEEDFALGQKYGLEIVDVITEDGRFQNAPMFDGLSLAEGTKKVLEVLKVLSSKQFAHSYPYSWRSHTPLIYKVTPQWYLRLDKARVEGIAKRIKWIPDNDRFMSMMNSRGDWCISRQRIWGTPLALFMHKDSKQPVFDVNVLMKTVEYLKKYGVDSWFEVDCMDILGHDEYEKCLDTLDVWFDAGCMQECLKLFAPEIAYPADAYLEGSDQHRGFFQACLFINDDQPVDTIVTHGFILDAKGRKMSKSLGNVVSPTEVIDEYGVDVVRLWVALSDCALDVKYSKLEMDNVRKKYFRFRNTIRYLLSCLEDKLYESDFTETVELSIMQKIKYPVNLALLMKFYSLGNPDKYEYTQFYRDLYDFCNDDLSSFFFDINKIVVYCRQKQQDVNQDDEMSQRNEILAVYRILVVKLIKYCVPVLKFMGQELSDMLGIDLFQERFSTELRIDEKYLKLWKELSDIRDVANEAIERLRADKLINQTLQAKIEVIGDVSDVVNEQMLSFVTMTGEVKLVRRARDGLSDDVNENVIVKASVFDGVQCVRCRGFVKSVKSGLCSECV